MSKQLFLLELNEINVESVEFYVSRGGLPNFKWLLDKGCRTTTSEQQYEHLEPWIQWVTAHTGLTFAEHGVFRLGDIVKKDLPQIWELLEAHGLKVGAISPMNAKHRMRSPAFFVPDPWTPTDVTAPRVLARLYRAIAQAVNDNAAAKVTLRSALDLAVGILRYAHSGNYARYANMLRRAVGCPWVRSMFLDLLLADVFRAEAARTKPHFATLFLNAGAHIQHHYMFSSAAYGGKLRNPSWYAPPGADPVREVYELYDHILGSLRSAFPNARFMVATGLHQVPHESATFYWRLRDHESFLRKIGVEFVKVAPRMSRDFLVECADAQQAERAARRMSQAVAADGRPLFEVDNRGADVFAMLVYPGDIGADFVFRLEDREYFDFRKDVVFVAIKNGEHSGIGYFFDSEAAKGAKPSQFPLADLPGLIMQALDIQAGEKLPATASAR